MKSTRSEFRGFIQIQTCEESAAWFPYVSCLLHISLSLPRNGLLTGLLMWAACFVCTDSLCSILHLLALDLPELGSSRGRLCLGMEKRQKHREEVGRFSKLGRAGYLQFLQQQAQGSKRSTLMVHLGDGTANVRDLDEDSWVHTWCRSNRTTVLQGECRRSQEHLSSSYPGQTLEKTPQQFCLHETLGIWTFPWRRTLEMTEKEFPTTY